MLISIEIMLLAITFLILVSSLYIDDIIGQTYAIYIIAVAGAESAIGLGILVAFYRFINSPVKNPRSKSSYSHFNSLPKISPCNFTISRNLSSGGKLRLPLKPEASFSLLETCESKIVLNPSFISGFSDAEGSFVLTILKNPRYKIG